MLTRYIEVALKGGYSNEYLRMLHNYGLWSRYFGAVGYLSGQNAKETYDIDDDSGLIIDRAMQMLKNANFRGFKLLEYYYSRGWDEGDILSVICTNKGALELNLSRDELRILRKAHDHHIQTLIVRAEKQLLVYLEDMENA